MPIRRPLAFLVASTVVASSFMGHASGPTFWTVATAAAFLKGTSDGIYVSRDGVVTAGPELTSRLSSTPAQVWSLAEAGDGTIWAGTGGDGRLLRLRPGQIEETVFDSAQSHIFAVAVSASRVYAATSPDGRVYVIEGSAPARPFFDPAEKYIWALSVDESGGLWIGAGSPATIYRVGADGTGQVVYRPPAANVVSLARDGEGRLLAGTDAPGRLYRFGTDGRPFVLLDSGDAELRAVAAGPDGTVYAASVARAEDAPPASGEPASVSATIVAPSSGTPAATTPPSERRSQLFRIDQNGTWEAVWTTADLIYDVAVTDEGAALVATGPEGRLYQVERTGNVLLLSGVDAKQITRFAGRPHAGARLPAFATANPGRLMVPGPGDHFPATYISSVRDSQSIALWGLIRWQSAGAVALYTRSGNTVVPDDSWSDWAGPYTRNAGEAITSPASRYLQFRATLTRTASGPTPRLTSVTIAYLPRNSRPLVSVVTVHPPGVVFQRPFTSDETAIAGLDDPVADARRPPGEPEAPAPAPGKRMFQKGLQTVTWKAEDADGDHLTFRLQYRREGETEWHGLRQDLSAPIYVWDTTAVADGRYVLRVEASDQPSNAAGRALDGSRESEPITVDNTPPAITTEVDRTAGRVRLVVHARDAHSPIQKLEYSIGGGPWQLVYPTDGVADSLDERYDIVLGTETDLTRVMLRATDLLQNVASGVVGGR